MFSCTTYAPALDWDTDREITTLVANMQQPSGSSSTISVLAGQPVLFQEFRTGPHRGGYELESISAYVRRTRDAR